MRGQKAESGARDADQVSIEAGSAAELPEVRALANACAEAPHWPPDAWHKFVEPASHAGDRRSVLLLARAPGGELVGWLAASGIYETAELEFLLVHPGCRGRGVARQLVGCWLIWAQERGAREALLEVRASNVAAIRLYGGLGFAERGRRQMYYDNPAEDAILMRRPLVEGGRV